MRLISPWKCWLSGWLLLASSGVLSQGASFNVRHFSVEAGMSSRFVTNIIQDHQGFIWIGTDYGVNRFDGRHFKTYDFTQNRLRANTRGTLCLDVNGRIWVNNDQNQIDIIDPITEVVTPIDELMPEFAGRAFKIRGNDRLNRIWGTVDNDIVFNFDGKFHIIDHILPIASQAEKRISEFFVSPWGSLFLVGAKGLWEYDVTGRQLNFFELPLLEFGSVNLGDSSIMMVSYQRLPNDQGLRAMFWELTRNSPPCPLLFKDNGKPLYFAPTTSSFPSIGFNQDEQGRFWMAFLNELMVFEKDGNLIAKKLINEEFWRSLESEQIFFDTQGQAWVRAREGVFVVSMRQPNMRKLLQTSEAGVSVRGITRLHDDALLACTYDGLYLINIRTGGHKKIRNEIFFGAINAGDTAIWLGSHARTILKFDKRSQQFERLKISEKLNKTDEYLRPFEDPFTGQIYIGTRRQGIAIFDKNSQEFIPYEKLNQFADLAKLEVIYMLPTPDFIWLCTSNGIYQLDRQKGIVARFHDFPSNFIYHLTIDDQGVFWLSTRGGGLIKWYRNSSLMRQYTTTDGLSHNIIYAAYDDGLGHLWLPSNYGLMSFEKSTGITVNYLPDEGTANEEFNSSSHFRAADGTFYFGGLNGITTFHPATIASERFSQPLVVTGLKVLKDNVLENRIALFRQWGRIVVEPDERFFTLEFALLDFQSKKLVYAWNLEGLDKNWTVQTENNIRFNALPYGKFTLRIKAQGAGNAWTESELKIPIVVVRPFYRTWNFLVLCVLGFSLITFLAVRWRIRWLRREKRRLAQIVEERTSELVAKNAQLESANHVKDRLFSIIAHDLRSPLVTLGGLARKVAFLMRQGRMQEVQELGETVEGSVASVRNLLDNLLKWSIVEDGKFLNNPEILNIGEVAKEVVELYGAIAETKGIQLHLDNQTDPTAFADRTAVSTIVRNLVDNALKFTHEGGSVEVVLKGNSKNTTLMVRDTGIGIPADILPNIFNLKGHRGQYGTRGEKGNGLGLVLCKELAEINHGTIAVGNQPQGGTVFTVTLPAGEEQANQPN